MTTVLLRSITPAPPDAITPQIPQLGALARRIHARPLALATEPLCVDPATYEAAEREMIATMKKRGYDTIAMADIPQRNFLFLGVPICAMTESNSHG